MRGTFGRCLRNMVQGSARYLPGVRRFLFAAFWPLFAVVCNLIWRPYEGYNLRYARQFKQALSIPVLCVGGFLTPAKMEAAIEQNQCDAVTVGRGFIANPLLYRHLRDGTTGPRCVDCNACLGHIGTQPIDCYHPGVRAEKDAMRAALP